MSTREKLVKLLSELLKQLKNLTVSTYFQAIEMLREYIEAGGEFVWNPNATAEKKVFDLLKMLEGKINIIIANGVSTFYQEGLNAAEELVQNALKGKGQIKKNRDIKLLKQHATEEKRKQATAGHAQTVSYRGGAMNNLSNRVWDFKDGAKKQIEEIVQKSIKEGKSVNEAKNSVKEYLNTTSKGTMKHGGQKGVYSDPLKNCERLLRTEVNAAYRSAEIDSYQNDDTILGFRISLSGNHTTKDHKGKVKELNDICDILQGDYPKTFYWTGWHPNCRCVLTPIVISPEQFGKYMEAEDEGKEREYFDSIKIKDFPPNFKTYWSEHSSQFQAIENGNKQLPPWIENNKNILPTIPSPQTPPTDTMYYKYEHSLTPTPPATDEPSKEEIQKQRNFNSFNDKEQFKEFKRNEEKIIKQKGKFNAKNENYYTGEIYLRSEDVESLMFHCFSELEVNAVKQIHNILPNLKNGEREELNKQRPNYQEKIKRGYLYFVSYDVKINGVDFVLKCKVESNKYGVKEYPYSLKEKQ